MRQLGIALFRFATMGGCLALSAVAALTVASMAYATESPEPSGPHPRLLLGPESRRALSDLSHRPDSFVSKTIKRCTEIRRNPGRFQTDGYMGLDWAQYLQACLIAYQATGKEIHGETALVYFKALIDDLKTVGDGAGGNNSARRDSGFAIRALGPNAAIAYDWLHDFPGVDEDLRSRARERFDAWIKWYQANGYRATSPGTNYHAGYVLAATFIAIAQGGEAGAAGTALWKHVVSDIFERDIFPAMRDDGVLVGGDWGEGWQYGPLSVLEYALAAESLSHYDVEVDVVEKWLHSVMKRHLYGLIPGREDRTFAVGDTQIREPYIPVRAETLASVILGPGSDVDKMWAESEMRRMDLYDDVENFPMFKALAEAAQVSPGDIPRHLLPAVYVADGIGQLYARFNWSAEGVWFATSCSRVRDVDHMHPNAGNFVLNRGPDPIIVDPSPYGTLSSLTSNAPTLGSLVLPAEYQPSQGYWGKKTHFQWQTQSENKDILLVRCDYADQFTLQDKPSDSSMATRDFIVIAEGAGEDVILLVVDRAITAGKEQRMHLRFRTSAELQPGAKGYVGVVGESDVYIRQLYATEGVTDMRRLPAGDCFRQEYTRGNCDAARFPISEYRVRLNGPYAEAAHLIVATGSNSPETKVEDQGGVKVISIREAEKNVVVAVGGASGDVIQVAPASGPVVILDLGIDSVKKSASGECQIALTNSDGSYHSSDPTVIALGEDCDIVETK